MVTPTPKEALRELARSRDVKRTKRGRLRELLPEIEEAKAAGIGDRAIVAKLNEAGLELTVSAFQSALSRIRKSHTPGGLRPPRVPLTSDASATPTPPQPSTAEGAQGAEDTPQTLPAIGPDGLPLSARQLREQRAAQFINPENSNRLLKSLKEKKQ